MIEAEGAEGPVMLKTAEVAQISGDIMGQIYARDFKTIDQSDMIVSLVPEQRQAGIVERSGSCTMRLREGEVYVIYC